MKARIIPIGNSRGLRLPKTVLEQAGLVDDVELEVRGNTVVIVAARTTRAGWAEAAQALHAAGSDRLLDPETPTRFDEEEWDW